MLRQELESFNEITVRLIDALDKDLLDELNQLFQERHQIISRIDALAYSRAEFIQICEELGIVELQEKLAKRMEDKREVLRVEMGQYMEHKNASKSYSSKFSADAIYLNKKS